MTAVENAYVKTASGAAVPVSQVANVRPVFEPGVEWRRDRLPTITVRALIPDGIQSPDVTKAIYNQLEPLRNSLPPGYRIEMQGAVEESAKGNLHRRESADPRHHHSNPADGAAASFRHTLLVLSTAPLGIIGAASALLIFQAPFGFVAILGVIALAGIIMRNTVILVDQIEQDMGSGIDAYNAIVGSAVRRFRPIMLTAAAAVLALIPLAESSFWGPMALAMMGGIVGGDGSDDDVSARSLRLGVPGRSPSGGGGEDSAAWTAITRLFASCSKPLTLSSQATCCRAVFPERQSLGIATN